MPNEPTVADGDGARTTPSPVTIIGPRRAWTSLNVGELWEYRELLYFLVWRNVKVRYKQTVVGALWVILQPVMTMIVFTIIFGHLAHLPSNGLPYPIFSFAGLLPWQLFVAGLSGSSISLVASAGLFTKVYFPRLAIPMVAVATGLVDFAVAFFVLIGLMVYYGVAPSIAILSLPLFILLAIATAFAVGLWLSVLNLKYRDIQYTVPFLTQFWLFLTPIAYATTLVPEHLRTVYALNPLVGVVDGFRWSLLGTGPGLGVSFAVSVGVVAVILAGGLVYFRRMERTFADVV